MSIDNSSVFIQVPFPSLEHRLERLVENRIQPEIGFTGPDLDRLEPDRLARIGESLAEAGLALTVHAPYNDLNPGALEPLVAEVTAKRLRQSLQCASRLGAQLMVVHAGYDPWRYGFHEEPWLEKSREFWPPVLEEALRLDLPVALENVFDPHPWPLVGLLDELSAPGFGFCLDVGHFELFQSAPLEEWLERISPFLLHMHLHDNHGDRDDHLPIGRGSFDFALLFSLLRARRLAPSITLENRSIEDALASRKALGSLL